MKGEGGNLLELLGIWMEHSGDKVHFWWLVRIVL